MAEGTRIAICGGPRVGKTSFARSLASEHGAPAVSTDDFMGAPWPAIPDLVLAQLRNLPAWILEDTQAARVLRRWLNEPAANPGLTCVYWLEKPLVELRDGQASMAKGVATVFADVRPKLYKLGVPVFPGLPPDFLRTPPSARPVG